MASGTGSPGGGSNSSELTISFVGPSNTPLIEPTTTGSPDSGISSSEITSPFAESTLIALTITVSSDGGSNSSETSNPSAEPTTPIVGPTNTPIVEVATPFITITPPMPTSRSRLTYNPTMDYTPTRAANTPFTPDVQYIPPASAGNMLAPHVENSPTTVARNMFLFGSGPSGDVRVNYPMGIGQTSPVPTTRTHLTPPSNQTRPNGNRRSATNPRPFYNTARVARGHTRAATHREAAAAAAEAAAIAAAYPLHSPERVLHHLSLLEESKALHLAAFKEHSKNLFESRAVCALMRASPDAESRLNEIEVMEEAISVLVQAVKEYGHRFESLGYDIEQKYSDLYFGDSDDSLEAS